MSCTVPISIAAAVPVVLCAILLVCICRKWGNSGKPLTFVYVERRWKLLNPQIHHVLLQRLAERHRCVEYLCKLHLFEIIYAYYIKQKETSPGVLFHLSNSPKPNFIQFTITLDRGKQQTERLFGILVT